MESLEAIQWVESMSPMEKKIQHVQHCDWSRTAWTAPAVTQLTETVQMVLFKAMVVSRSALALKLRSLLYSVLVQSENFFADSDGHGRVGVVGLDEGVHFLN